MGFSERIDFYIEFVFQMLYQIRFISRSIIDFLIFYIVLFYQNSNCLKKLVFFNSFAHCIVLMLHIAKKNRNYRRDHAIPEKL